MKKLIILVALLIAPLINAATDTTGTSSTKGVSQSIPWGQGVIWADSLWEASWLVPNDTTIAGSDTTIVLDTISARLTFEIPLDYEYDWMTLTAIDTGATYTDSSVVEFAAYEFGKKNVRGFPQDTISTTHWNTANFLRDSTWTNVTTIAGADLETSYTAFVGGLAKIRVRIINAEAVENRVWKFIVQLSRKK